MYKVEEFITEDLHKLEEFLNYRAKNNYSVVQIIKNNITKWVCPGVSIDVTSYTIIFKYNENLD